MPELYCTKKPIPAEEYNWNYDLHTKHRGLYDSCPFIDELKEICSQNRITRKDKLIMKDILERIRYINKTLRNFSPEDVLEKTYLKRPLTYNQKSVIKNIKISIKCGALTADNCDKKIDELVETYQE